MVSIHKGTKTINDSHEKPTLNSSTCTLWWSGFGVGPRLTPISSLVLQLPELNCMIPLASGEQMAGLFSLHNQVS